MNLPNKLTVGRIILVPFFVAAMLIDFPLHHLVALIIFVIASLTDMLDGKIARKYNMVSNLGKILDPIADKLSQVAIVIILIFKFWSFEGILKYLLFLFIAKELIMVIAGAVLLAKGMRPVAAEMWGKVATTVFYIFMIAIIAIGPNGALVGVWFFKALPTPVVYVMVIISVILAFVSLFGYAPGFIRQIKENKNKN